jgi:signal peptidase II
MSRLRLDNFRNPVAVICFVGTCMLGLALDLFTKVWAFRALERGEQHVLIPRWLQFEVTLNPGAVFGLGAGQRWLFVCVSIAAIAFLSWLFASSERKQYAYHILLGMLLAGVLGNLYDRIRFGEVRDMIHALAGFRWPGTWQLPLFNYPAPPERAMFPYIFNIADSLLCVGVFLMIVYSFIHQPKAASELTAGKVTAPAAVEK